MTTSPPDGSEPGDDGARGDSSTTPRPPSEPDHTQVLPVQQRPSSEPAHRAPRPVPGAAPPPPAPEPDPATPVPEADATNTPDAAVPAPRADRTNEDATVAMPVTPTTGAQPADHPDEESTVAIPTSGPAPASTPDETAPYSPDTYASDRHETTGYEADRTPPTVAIPVQAPTGQDATGQAPAGDDAWSTAAPEPSAQASDIFPESMYGEPPSRAGSHWWGVLIALALTPISWFLLVDGSARVFWSLTADPANVNIAGVLGLAGGLLLLTTVLLSARWSSVGTSIAGSISALVGLAFLVLPVRTLDVLAQIQDRVESFGGFGRNLYAYTVESGLRGTFLVAGVVLVLVGVVSHGARRKGRREEKARLAVRAAQGENPFA